MKFLKCWPTCIALFAAMSAVGTAAAANISTAPGELHIRSMHPGVVLQLTQDGKPVPASAIGPIHFKVETRDYTYMLDIKRADGALHLTPTDQIQMGSYLLYVDVAGETVSIPVKVPLDKLPTSLESLSEAQGKTVEELKTDLGLTQTLPRSEISVKIPESYTLGKALTLPMKPEAGTTFAWSINGVEVARGTGEHVFTYVFSEPGAYVVDYQELRDGKEVGRAVAATVVSAEDPVPWEVPLNAQAKLTGPEGFNAFAWSVDGEFAGAGEAFAHTFTEGGRHTITCQATLPDSGPPESFRIITYDVTAK